MSLPEVIVLLKETSSYDGETFTSVMGVYGTVELLRKKIENIEKANPQYPMVQVGETSWRIGPDEDEGFFGNRPIYLRAQLAKFLPGNVWNLVEND